MFGVWLLIGHIRTAILAFRALCRARSHASQSERVCSSLGHADGGNPSHARNVVTNLDQLVTLILTHPNSFFSFRTPRHLAFSFELCGRLTACSMRTVQAGNFNELRECRVEKEKNGRKKFSHCTLVAMIHYASNSHSTLTFFFSLC